ncbi:hypothetical protein HELRODRAFT_192722 [Helobdella robusta]|uniref:Uncharacterized protein n=1 Tax=Helobdella robusta TaxID=6412 RepID=T1FU81_HELRO|nr:hypothetical protein HELRODRAFT_192722 [Helobdella robusta]ESO00072.1 hypothetical protein HELRODRAFT_192722 [Helobdella robusta]
MDGAHEVIQAPDHKPLITMTKLSELDRNFLMNHIVAANIASKDDILRSLDANAYDHTAATYYLLAEKLLRKRAARQKENMMMRKRMMMTTDNASSNSNGHVVAGGGDVITTMASTTTTTTPTSTSELSLMFQQQQQQLQQQRCRIDQKHNPELKQSMQQHQQQQQQHQQQQQQQQPQQQSQQLLHDNSSLERMTLSNYKKMSNLGELTEDEEEEEEEMEVGLIATTTFRKTSSSSLFGARNNSQSLKQICEEESLEDYDDIHFDCLNPNDQFIDLLTLSDFQNKNSFVLNPLSNGNNSSAVGGRVGKTSRSNSSGASIFGSSGRLMSSNSLMFRSGSDTSDCDEQDHHHHHNHFDHHHQHHTLPLRHHHHHHHHNQKEREQQHHRSISLVSRNNNDNDVDYNASNHHQMRLTDERPNGSENVNLYSARSSSLTCRKQNNYANGSCVKSEPTSTDPCKTILRAASTKSTVVKNLNSSNPSPSRDSLLSDNHHHCQQQPQQLIISNHNNNNNFNCSSNGSCSNISFIQKSLKRTSASVLGNVKKSVSLILGRPSSSSVCDSNSIQRRTQAVDCKVPKSSCWGSCSNILPVTSNKTFSYDNKVIYCDEQCECSNSNDSGDKMQPIKHCHHDHKTILSAAAAIATVASNTSNKMAPPMKIYANTTAISIIAASSNSSSVRHDRSQSLNLEKQSKLYPEIINPFEFLRSTVKSGGKIDRDGTVDNDGEDGSGGHLSQGFSVHSNLVKEGGEGAKCCVNGSKCCNVV